MRLIPFLSICALGLSGFCLPATAGTLIVNGSLGRDCYMATMLEPTVENNRKAIAACDLAVASTVDDEYSHMAAYVNRADVRLRMQDFQAAVARTPEQAIALVPSEGVAYLNRGAGMVGLKQYQDAVEVLTHAIALNVRPPEAAYFNRGLAKIPGRYPGRLSGLHGSADAGPQIPARRR